MLSRNVTCILTCLLPLYCRLNSVTNDQSTSIGQTMNLVSNDVERFLLAALYGPSIIWGPLQALAILTVGLYLNGPAFAIGVGMFLFVLIPGQTYLSRRFVSLRSKVRRLNFLLYSYSRGIVIRVLTYITCL